MFGMVPYRKQDRNLFSLMNDFEKEFLSNAVNGSNQFRCDISDKGDSYLVEAELPGFDKDNIKVHVADGLLTISAERNEETENKDKEGYVRRERRYGSFSRSFDLTGIKAEDIKCAYNNGILNVTLPKEKETAPTARQIPIE